jgi:WD40 repeat protein
VDPVSFDDVRRRLARGELIPLLTEWLSAARTGDVRADYARLLRANAHRLHGDGADDMLLSLALALPEGAPVRRDADAWLRDHAPAGPWLRQVAGPSPVGAALWTFHDREMGWYVGRGLAVHPDGRRVAVSSRDGMIRVFDLATTACVARLLAHKKSVTALAWSPDGALLASGAEDRQLALWDASGYTLRWATRAHVGEVASVLFLPDGRVASFGGEGAIKLWDPASLKAVATISVGVQHSGAMAWFADHRVVTVGYQQPTRVVDLAARAVVRELPAPTGWNFSVAAVPGSARLVTTGTDTTLWDLASGERLADFGVAGRCVVVSPSGDRAYVGTEEGVVWALDLARGTRLGVVASLPHRVAATALVPGAAALVTLDLDGWVSLWDLDAPAGAPTESERGVCVAATRSGAAVVAGPHRSSWWEPERDALVQTGGADLAVYDTATGARAFELVGARFPVVELGDGTLLTAAGDDDAKRWDLATGACLATFPGRLQARASCPRFLGRLAPDGEHLVHVEREGDGDAVVVWSALSGHTTRRLSHPGRVLTAVPVAGGRVVSVEVGGAVRVFAQDGDAPPTVALTGLAGVPRSTRALPGRDEAVSIVGRAVVRWSTVTGEVLGRVKTGAALLCLAPHPDGVRVLGIDKKSLHVIDLAAGKVVANFTAEAAGLLHVLAHADGRHAVTVDGHWHHALWDLDAGRCLGRWPSLNCGFSGPLEGPWWAAMLPRAPLEVIDVASGQGVARWWPDGPARDVQVLPGGRVFVTNVAGACVLSVEGP